MPRKPRLEAPDLLYHVIGRGIERKEIFSSGDDYLFFLKTLGKILNDTGTKCFAFTLMTNHFHLLIKSSSIPLSSIMRRLLTTYAIYFNKKNHRAGHLFQNRYKSIICEEDSYLLELIRYIHLNPKRAGIVKTMTELNSYPYSGHIAIAGKKNYSWYDSSDVLSFFGKQKNAAINKYLQFIKDGIDMKTDARFSGGGLKRSLNYPDIYPKEKQFYDDRILGSGDFVLTLLSDNDKSITKAGENIDDIIKRVAKDNNITHGQITSRSKSTNLSKARAEIVKLCTTNLKMSFAEVARHLNVNRSTVTRLARRK